MEWPNRLLLVVLGLAATAVFVPWVIPRARRGLLFGFIASLAATWSWILYENQIRLIARPGDPLIRIDLLLIKPLVTLDWLSAIASIAIARRGRQMPNKAANPSGTSGGL